MICWGGSPYPNCKNCGHDRMQHMGAHAPANNRQHSSLSVKVRPREGKCDAVVGTGWCKCEAYDPEV